MDLLAVAQSFLIHFLTASEISTKKKKITNFILTIRTTTNFTENIGVRERKMC